METLDYRRILDAFADPVVAIHGYRDRQPDSEPGRIIYANRAAEILLGWPPGTLLGRPVTDIMPPRFQPLHTAGLQRYLQTQVPHLIGHALKVPALCHDGTELEIELRLSAVPGGIAGAGEVVVAALHDLRERIELERQLAVTRYLRAATAMAATLASRLNLDDVLQTVVETLVRDFDAFLARVWLYDDTANMLHLRASAGSATATAASARAHIDVATYPYKVGVVARTRQPFVKNGLAGDPEFGQEWIAREGIAAIGMFPLLARDQLLGVLACFSRVEFPPEVVEVLNAFVSMVTASITDVRHLQREREARASAEATERRLATVATSLDRALAEAELLNAITTAAAGEEALDRILTVSLDHLHRAVNFTGGSIALVEGDDLVLQAAVGPFADRALGQRLLRHESATWRAVAAGEPFLSPDVLADGPRPTTDIRSYLAVPLRWRGAVYGFLELDSTIPDAFSQDDLLLLRKVAAALSGPIELARRYTREVQATAAAAAAQRRLAFLSEASTVLASSLDYEATLASIAQLAVPDLADWCVVDIVDEHGALRRLNVAHADPTKAEWARELERRYPPVDDPTHIVVRTLRTGRSLLATEVPDAVLSAVARDAEHLRILRALGIKSHLIVPLVARGRALGALTFVAAESGRRYIAEDLTLAEDLARRVAVAIDNAQLYREAREAIQVRDRFLTIAAHELRTPITTVRGNTELLLRRVERASVPLDRAWLAERLRRLMTGVERLHALAARVLDLNNLQAGVFDLARAECDLTAIVAGVVDRLQAALPPRSPTQLAFRHSPEPVVGEWDPVRLEQVVVNLLQNAIKYQPAGGVVRVTLEATADEALLRIRDQGIGIAEEDLPRLFAPFARADTARKREIGGVGLGLYISSQLIRLHGGALDVTSVVGEGSEFTIRLPRAPR